MTNQTLRIIKLGMNPFESAGCFSVIKALQKNPMTKLELIDFSVKKRILIKIIYMNLFKEI